MAVRAEGGPDSCTRGRERQPLVQPLVIGWGYDESAFALAHDWESTFDPAAYLAVPAAIAFVREHGRDEECRELLRRGVQHLAEAGFETIAPGQPLQMAAFQLPCDPEEVQRRLLEGFKGSKRRAWNGRHLIRVSIAPCQRAVGSRPARRGLAEVIIGDPAEA